MAWSQWVASAERAHGVEVEFGLEQSHDRGLARRVGLDPDELVGRPLDDLGGGILIGRRRLPGHHGNEAGADEGDGGCTGGQAR